MKICVEDGDIEINSYLNCIWQIPDNKEAAIEKSQPQFEIIRKDVQDGLHW